MSVLPPAEHEVIFNSDGVCLVNGTPFFPLGLYHLGHTIDQVNEGNARAGEPTVTWEQMFERVAAKGFNSAVSWGFGDRSFLEERNRGV